MQSTDYRAEMAAYWQRVSETDENRTEHSRLLQSLTRCLREDVTPRQRDMLALYYGKQLSQVQIAARLGVARSTVCRTLKRGEERMRRCLRYGLQRYLMSLDEETGKEF